MTPVDHDVIRRKLETIIDRLEKLEPLAAMSYKEWISDFYRSKGTEKILQEIVEAAIDINTHVLREEGRQAADDYFGTFAAAAKLKLIPAKLADQLAPSTGLRNRLVHEYEDVDPKLVHKAIATTLKLYPRYVKAVEKYLAK